MIPLSFILIVAGMILLALALVIVPLLRMPPARPANGRGYGRWPAALATAIGVPLVAVTVYAMVGQPDALLRGAGMHRAVLADRGHSGSDGAVEALARRLRDKGDDGEGWILLARSYLQLNRVADALAAYRKAVELVPDNADIWVEYANTTAIANERRLAGEPERLVKRALAIEPDNLNALAFAGMAALQTGDSKLALTHWRRLEALVPADSEDHARVVQMIALAENGSVSPAASSASGASAPVSSAAAVASAAGPAGAAPAASATARPPEAKPSAADSIRGTVTIAAGLADKVAPSDTLYVFARAVDGPPMPLAAVRTRAQGWPVSFRLDDSSAMAQGLALSRFPKVNVVARVSRLGSPTAQPGDIEGVIENIPLGSEVRVVLDRVVGR